MKSLFLLVSTHMGEWEWNQYVDCICMYVAKKLPKETPKSAADSRTGRVDLGQDGQAASQRQGCC